MKNNYEFIGIDEGKQCLIRANTKDCRVRWIRSLAEYPTARALQRLDNRRVLMGYDKGYCIFDIENGAILHDCRRWTKITSAFRNADGTTLLTGQDLENNNGVCVLTLDSSDTLIHSAVCPGNYVRLMTITKDKKYLLSTNDHIKICDEDLNTISMLSANGFLHAWQSQVLEDHSILVSAGYGAFMARFSQDGTLLATFGKKNHMPEEINPFFYASFQICEDGSILLANWQGHGPDNGELGKQLILFSSEGEYRESWSFPEEVSSLQGLLLLMEL